MEELIYFKRNLPHYHLKTGRFFITFRLANSVPRGLLEKLKIEYKMNYDLFVKIVNEEKRKEAIYNYRKKYFEKFDRILNSSNNRMMWLANDKIALNLYNLIKEYDGAFYNLISFTIMPNHVHLLIVLDEESDNSSYDESKNYTKISFITKRIKGKSARESNLALKRSGAFWHHESYDHIVRNDKEFVNIISYILMNPVKAGLVNNWKDWKWSYIKDGYLEDYM